MKNKKIMGLFVFLSLLLSFSMLSLFPSVFALPYKYAGGNTITDPSNDVIKMNKTNVLDFTMGDMRDGMDVTLVEISGQTINVTFQAAIDTIAVVYIMIDTDNNDVGNYTIAYHNESLGEKVVMHQGNYDTGATAGTLYWNSSNQWEAFPAGYTNAGDVGNNNSQYLNVTIPPEAYNLTATDEFVVYVFDETTSADWYYIDYAPDLTLSDFLPPIPGFEWVFVGIALASLMGLFLWRKNKVNIPT